MMRSTQISVVMALVLAGAAARAAEPRVLNLWNKGAPGFESRRAEPEQAQSYWVKNIHNPTLTVFLPAKEKATGIGVVICPGGGHRLLVHDAEGKQAAEYLASIGVAAFVLKYRLAREEGSPYALGVHAREDGLRAMRLVRSQAAKFGVDPKRLGMMGFSAGGEVVSWVTWGETAGNPKAPDPIDRASARPDFQVLIYPGPHGIPDVVPAGAPPAFLLVANDDGATKNIASMFEKYRAASAPVEVHVYMNGRHGFNMGDRSSLASIRTWRQRLADWLEDHFVLDGAGLSRWQREAKEKDAAEARRRAERQGRDAGAR